MDLTTNGVVITDAINFVQTNKEKLTMSTKEGKEPDYNEDEDQLEFGLGLHTPHPTFDL